MNKKEKQEIEDFKSIIKGLRNPFKKKVPTKEEEIDTLKHEIEKSKLKKELKELQCNLEE
jgi:hypothetical protein